VRLKYFVRLIFKSVFALCHSDEKDEDLPKSFIS